MFQLVYATLHWFEEVQHHWNSYLSCVHETFHQQCQQSKVASFPGSPRLSRESLEMRLVESEYYIMVLASQLYTNVVFLPPAPASPPPGQAAMEEVC